MVKNYTDSQLLKRVQELESFRGFPLGYWVLGVRSQADIINKFDDKFYIWFSNGNEEINQKFITVLKGTTNPGYTILKGGFKKYNRLGAAVVKSNIWFYDVYKYGLHRGKMPALRQRRNKPMLYHRDKNLNGKSEELGEVYNNVIYTNFHGSTYNEKNPVTKDNINSWSAGCQVVSENKKYFELMKKFALASLNQKYFTYCLIKEF